MKLFFAAIILLLALPFWRLLDLLAVLSPFKLPLTAALIFWFAVFLALPIKLIFSKFKSPYLIVLISLFGVMAFFTEPASNMATMHPELNHCSRLTFTGVFYPVRELLSDAHRDDLEARNQLCWVRKMITRIPEKFDLDFYNKLLQEKLLRPERKYRVALPLIATLYVKVNITGGGGPKGIYDSLHFWSDHYTEEIGQRKYSLWSWPHSEVIKWEYGLVERNWQTLIDEIVLEER